MDTTAGALGERSSAALWRFAVGGAVLLLALRVALVELGELATGAPLVPRLYDLAVPALVTLLMMATAHRVRAESPRLGAAWFCFGLAYLSYTAAELLWAVFGVGYSDLPAAYVVAVLTLLFYPLFLAGTWLLPRVPMVRNDRTTLLLDCGIVTLASGFLIWAFLVMPALASRGAASLRVVMTLALPIADLIVLWALLTLVFRRYLPTRASVWRLLAFSAGFLIITDAVYSYMLMKPDLDVSTVLALGWTTSHLLAGLAAARQLTRPRAAAPVEEPRVDRRPSHASVYLAYGAILVALAPVLGTHLSRISIVSAVALLGTILLGLARSIFGAAENQRLNQELVAARNTLEDRVRERTAELARTNEDLRFEVTERLRAEEGLEREIGRIAALRAIDAAISGSMDLRVTMDVFLDKTIEQLGVTAARVLLLDPVTGGLEEKASKGVTGGFSRRRTALGEGVAGTAALERRLAVGGGEQPGRAGSAVCAAVPMIARGEVRGVLEVLGPPEDGEEWRDFFEVLAGQGAIAIDHMSLFERTQRSNLELLRAYESTLEGWSLALELRDHDTQGHTLRVTEMAVRLAAACGMEGDELVQVRRGALLHDIGKVAIPDRVLLKPGPLDDEEWAIMRRHPEHAFEMLSRIAYLRPALDIPLYHHERWDGSGYPRGLSGRSIPLADRVFAVVDSWDALSFTRPYREAWPADRVREYLMANAGVLFDPEVVERFLEMAD